MVVRVRYRVGGGHVHCRVFVGKTYNDTLTLAGELTFTVEEWDQIHRHLSRQMHWLGGDLFIHAYPEDEELPHKG